MIKKELEFLFKGIARNPKSYTLWFHRQWVIERGLELERDYLAAIKQKMAKAKQKA